MLHHDLEPVRDLYRIRDLTGQTFGRLTVLNLAGRRREYRVYWRCRCECGEVCDVYGGFLTKGKTRSCGCLYRSVVGKHGITHGKARTRVYHSWLGMRSRCYNKRNKMYPTWGGRGITVCDRWRDSFENFYADMGEPPLGTSLDRIDNDGNYEPSNCRWATHKEQANNMRKTLILEIDGRRQPLTHWAKETGIDAKLIRNRIARLGWPITRDLFKPPRPLKTKRTNYGSDRLPVILRGQAPPTASTATTAIGPGRSSPLGSGAGG